MIQETPGKRQNPSIGPSRVGESPGTQPIPGGNGQPDTTAAVERTFGMTDKDFGRLQRFIETELGIKMPPAKKTMLESRLQKRMRAVGITAFSEYIDHVFEESNRDGELIHMIDAVTTNKTDFFREPDHFRYLSEKLLPLHVGDGWGIRQPFLVWSSASSTGEEPYTLAMVLDDFRATNPRFEYRILATDISTNVLERGRKAIYAEDRIIPVPDRLKKKYLLRSKDTEKRVVRVIPELRARVFFHRLNLMANDYNINDTFDVIFCRNVIIYFDRTNQTRLLRKLYEYLRPGGYLFLGHSETLAGMELPLFSVAPTIYRKPG